MSPFWWCDATHDDEMNFWKKEEIFVNLFVVVGRSRRRRGWKKILLGRHTFVSIEIRSGQSFKFCVSQKGRRKKDTEQQQQHRERDWAWLYTALGLSLLVSIGLARSLEVPLFFSFLFLYSCASCYKRGQHYTATRPIIINGRSRQVAHHQPLWTFLLLLLFQKKNKIINNNKSWSSRGALLFFQSSNTFEEKCSRYEMIIFFFCVF